MPSPILPIGISFYDWTAALQNTLSRLRVPLPMHEKDWRQWAEGVFLINGSAAGNLPYPDKLQYPTDEDWKSWAASFIQLADNP